MKDTAPEVIKKLIINALMQCSDNDLLDLIYKLLIKSL